MDIITSLKTLMSKFPSIFKEGMSQQDFDAAVDNLLTTDQIQSMIDEGSKNYSEFENRLKSLETQIDVTNKKSLAFAFSSMTSKISGIEGDLTNLSASVADIVANNIEEELLEDEGNPFMTQVSNMNKGKSNGVTVVKLESPLA